MSFLSLFFSSSVFPSSQFQCPLLMFCPPPSCVCCLIAEPPSPRPWDPPGSMYHLLCHLSFFLFFSFFSIFLSSSPCFSFFLSSVCLPPCAPLILVECSHPSTTMDKVTILHMHYTLVISLNCWYILHATHKFTISTNIIRFQPWKGICMWIQGMLSTLSCFSAINYSNTVLQYSKMQLCMCVQLCSSIVVCSFLWVSAWLCNKAGTVLQLSCFAVTIFFQPTLCHLMLRSVLKSYFSHIKCKNKPDKSVLSLVSLLFLSSHNRGNYYFLSIPSYAIHLKDKILRLHTR